MAGKRKGPGPRQRPTDKVWFVRVKGFPFRTFGKGQDAYKEALKYHLETLAIRRKALGPRHPYVAASLNNIGNVHYSLGQTKNAIDYYRNSLTIYKKALGPNHPLVAHPLNNLGFALSEQGEYEAALKNLNSSLQILEKAFGTEHPLVVRR